MDYCTEVCKIIEAGLSGDKAKLLSYAKLIANHLEKAGEERQHRMVSRAMDPTLPKGAPAVLDGETSNCEVLGWITYDFENQKEIFTPNLNKPTL